MVNETFTICMLCSLFVWVGICCMGTHSVPGHIMYRYILKQRYACNYTIQNYTVLHNALYRAIPDYAQLPTGINRAIKSNFGL